MGNFFSFINYNKPVLGVPKNEPPKPRIIVFFRIYLNKFWNLVKLNLLFSFFNLPSLISVYFLFVIFYGNLQGLLAGGGMFFSFIVLFAFASVFLSIPALTTGPAQAGFTYVLRNYSRQEHSFIWSDFKEHVGKNFKQGLIISIIDFIVILFLFMYLIFGFHVVSLLSKIGYFRFLVWY